MENQLPQPSEIIGQALYSFAKSFIIDKLKQKIMQVAPFLYTGPMGWLTSWVLSYIVTKVLDVALVYGEKGWTFLNIKLEVGAQHSDYVDAYDQFKKEPTTDNKTKLDDAYADLISLVRDRS